MQPKECIPIAEQDLCNSTNLSIKRVIDEHSNVCLNYIHDKTHLEDTSSTGGKCYEPRFYSAADIR